MQPNTFRQNFSARLGWLVGPVVAFIAFAPTLAIYFTGEDFVFIKFAASGQPFYRTAQNLFYRPLPNLLWQLDYSLWDLQAGGYHFTNVVLHAVNTGLVGLLGWQVSRQRAVGTIAALIFALHPVHIEPVTWATARPDLLATLFGLLTSLCVLQYFGGRGKVFYWLAVLSFALGLFSKEAVLTLPLVLAFWLLPTRVRPLEVRYRLIRQFLPFAGVGLIYLVVRFVALGGLGGYESDGRGLLNIGWNLTVGLWWPLLFPFNVEVVGWPVALVLAGLLVWLYGWLVWRYFRQHQLQAAVMFGLLWMYGNILPVLSNAPVTFGLSQSRLLYLPSVGFCLIAATVVNQNYKVKRASRILTAGVVGICTLLGVGLATGIGSWWQASTIAADTFSLLQKAQIVIQSGDNIYYEGVPDLYKGAYIWRNGLDEATQLISGRGVTGWRRDADLIVNYKQTATGRMWFVRYSLKDDQLSQTLLYSVDDEPITISKQISMASCQAGGWKLDAGEGRVECQTGRGILLNTREQKTSFEIDSPSVDINGRAMQLELVAYTDYDFQQPQALAEIQIFDPTGRELYHQPFDLAADGKTHHYRLYLPAVANGAARAVVSVNKVRTNLLLQAIYFGTAE